MTSTSSLFRRRSYGWSVVGLLCALILSPVSQALGSDEAVAAEEETADVSVGSVATSREITITERVNVVGSADDILSIAGAAHIIDLEELRENHYTDIHRILQLVPGVNVQEEDGYGLRPNIGMRGTGVERSQKITLLEDGVLIAPAPYSAPAAYYFPTAARMEAVEVRKGSSSIRQGPYTNGGSLNLISAAIPGTFSVRADFATGSNNTLRFLGLVGSASERFGWMLQTFQIDTDGFKVLDGGGDTGTAVDDYVGKLRLTSRSDSRLQQSLELKLGRTGQVGNETYLGLTDPDFRATPYRRYAGSAEDLITTDHEQVQLRYFAKPSARLDFTATVYNNEFFRDWFKNEKVAGISNRSILESPELYPRRMGILRGEIDSAPGEVHLRHNRRQYYSRGIESVLGLSAAPGRAEHQFEIGVRLHEDEEDRFQEEDMYTMRGSRLVLDALGLPGSNANRVGDARALAVFVEDRIVVGRWVLTPGARWESIRHRRFDYSKLDPLRLLGPVKERINELDVLLPGFGVVYEMGPSQHMFAGVHRGFAPPGTGSTEEVEPEESINYEVGYRFRSGAWSADVTGFYSDYSNLLGVETVAGGGSAVGDLFNGGEALVSGIEASMRGRWQLGSTTYVPVRVAYTFTETEFRSSFFTSFADWGPFVTEGDELPYVPNHQLQLSLGLQHGEWSSSLKASILDEVRTRAGQGPIPDRERTDSRSVLDLGVQWNGLEHFGFHVQLRNVLDEEYLVARRPYGARPGLPRTLLVGLTFDL